MTGANDDDSDSVNATPSTTTTAEASSRNPRPRHPRPVITRHPCTRVNQDAAFYHSRSERVKPMAISPFLKRIRSVVGIELLLLPWFAVLPARTRTTPTRTGP